MFIGFLIRAGIPTILIFYDIMFVGVVIRVDIFVYFVFCDGMIYVL